MSIVVIGDALIDELRDDRSVREFVGGAALNVAVGLARLGVPTTLIAMVGDDEPGNHIRAYLNDFGVRLIATPSLAGSARAVSTRTAGGEPQYEFNAAARGRRIRYGDEARAAIAEASLVAVSCVALDDPEQTAELAGALAGARVAIDPNPRAGMMRDGAEFARAFLALAHGAALIKVGADDADLLYGQTLDAVRVRLLDAGSSAVLATEGAAGATLDNGEFAVTAPIAHLPGPIVDTMGAGDATFAATLAAIVERQPEGPDEWTEILRHAMAIAAATCRFEGALLRVPEELTRLDDSHFGS